MCGDALTEVASVDLDWSIFVMDRKAMPTFVFRDAIFACAATTMVINTLCSVWRQSDRDI